MWSVDWAVGWGSSIKPFRDTQSEAYTPSQDQGLLGGDTLMVACYLIYLLQRTLNVCQSRSHDVQEVPIPHMHVLFARLVST